MRISDWSSDVCSSDLAPPAAPEPATLGLAAIADPTPWNELPAYAWPLSRPAKFLYLDSLKGMGLAVRLDNGTWLNTAYAKVLPNAFWTSQAAISPLGRASWGERGGQDV